MVVAGQWGKLGIADGGHGLDGDAIFFQAKALSRQNALVAAGVQVGETAGKLDFLAIHGNRPVGALALGFLRLGHVLVIHRQKPAHAGVLVFQVAGGMGIGAGMHHVGLQFAEYMVQHVEKMHADIGGDAARFFHVTLPRLQVPVPARRYIGQVHVVLGVFFLVLHFFPQSHNGRVHAQLQNGVDLAARIALDFLQAVDVPGVQHQGFFADGVGARTQGEAHVRIVQIVGRTDGYVVDVFRVARPAHFVDMAVEPLELGEEFRIGEMAVDDADRIVAVQRRHQPVAGVFDGFHMTRGNVAGRADQCEVLHEVVIAGWWWWNRFKPGALSFRIRLPRFAPQFGDLVLQRLVFPDLDLQEAGGQFGLGRDAGRGQQIRVRQLVLAVAEVLHLDQALVQQGANAVVGFAQAYAQGLRQVALAKPRIGFQQAQHLEMAFVLRWGIGHQEWGVGHATAVLCHGQQAREIRRSMDEH